MRRFDFAMARPERPLNIVNAVSVASLLAFPNADNLRELQGIWLIEDFPVRITRREPVSN